MAGVTVVISIISGSPTIAGDDHAGVVAFVTPGAVSVPAVDCVVVDCLVEESAYTGDSVVSGSMSISNSVVVIISVEVV